MKLVHTIKFFVSSILLLPLVDAEKPAARGYPNSHHNRNCTDNNGASCREEGGPSSSTCHGGEMSTSKVVVEYLPSSSKATISSEPSSSPGVVTVTISSSSSFSSSSSATSTITSATVKPTPSTMALKRDWRIDPDKLENLRAEKKCKMMYTRPDVKSGEQPPEKVPVAWVTMPEMNYPAIQLYNTNKISKVQCEGPKTNPQKITMQFNSQAAYDYAWNNWHNEVRSKDGDYLVITDAPGCWEGNGANQERSFLVAHSEERNNKTMTISCGIEAIPFSRTVPPDGLNDIEFGEWQPGQANGGVSANGDAGAESTVDTGPFKDTSGDSPFDQVLDQRIGPVNRESFEQSRLARAGFEFDDFYGDSGLQDLATENLNNSLAKRRIGDRIKRAFKKVGQAVKKAVTVVKDAVKKAADKIVEVAKEIGEKLNDFFTFDRSFSKDVNFDTIGRTNTEITPFNDARGILIASLDQERERGSVTISGKIDLFCVECGFEGNFVIGGSLRFSIGQGMEKAEVTLGGDMQAGFALGLVGSFEAKAENTTSFEFKPKSKSKKKNSKRLTSISIGDFLLPGILDIGPIASVDLETGISLALEGKIMAGVLLTWPNIDAKIDVKDPKNTKAEGFGPDVTPIFEADGQLTLEANAGLAFKLAFGISVLNGRFELTAGVRATPGASFAAAVAFEADLNGIHIAETDEGCRGIGIGVETDFVIDAVLKAGSENAGAEKVFPIKTIDGPGFSECIQLRTKRSLYRRQTIPPAFPFPSSELGNRTLENGLLTSMSTLDNTFRLRWSPNGNTYAVEEKKVPVDLKSKEWSGWFATDSTGNLIYGDSHGRLFHGYIESLQKWGVSRLRLHKSDNVPQTGWPVMFAGTIPDNSTNLATTNPTMIVTDFEGGIYFPIVCVYESEAVFPKVFIANSTEVGIETLLSNEQEILENISGEKIKECGFMLWTNFRTGSDVVNGAEDVE